MRMRNMGIAVRMMNMADGNENEEYGVCKENEEYVGWE